VPFPDPDRPIDILDAHLAAILEANIDPIANAFIDDPRAVKYASGLVSRTQSKLYPFSS
jgi:hypothetical protein